MKHVYLLLALAIGAPLLALLPDAQDPADPDWTEAVERACTARRYGMRIAAAKRVAEAGAEAVPAIAAFAEKNGRNTLPAELVDAIAKQTTTADAVVGLLLDWAQDRDFYWRPYAFHGLANRATALPARRAELVGLFTEHRDDPAWLVRAYSRFGLRLLDAGGDGPAADDDPRIASKLCGLLLASGEVPPLQPLLDALADERTFQGDPWGQYRANDAHKALRAALGDAHPMADGTAAEDKPSALAAVRAAIQAKWGQELTVPALRTDPEIDFAGGIAVQSCRNGDLYLQWTADGRLFLGIDAATEVRVPDAAWSALERAREAIALDGSHGVVICDSMRLRWDEPAIHSRIAPEALPGPAQEWLAQLASALHDADRPDLAAALRAALGQFGQG